MTNLRHFRLKNRYKLREVVEYLNKEGCKLTVPGLDRKEKGNRGRLTLEEAFALSKLYKCGLKSLLGCTDENTSV